MKVKKHLLYVINSLFLALCFGFTAQQSLRAADEPMEPVLVLSATSIDDFWDGIERIGEKMGYTDKVSGFRMVFGETQGVDTSKSLGFIVLANEKDYVSYSFFPVESFDDLEFGMFDKSTLNIEEKDGHKVFTAEDGTTMELIERDGWLFVIDESKANLLPDEDPEDLVAEMNEDSLLGVKIDPKNCPKALFETLYTWFRQQTGDPDTAAVARFELMKTYMTLLSESVEYFTMGLNVTDEGDLVFNTTIKPDNGTDLGKALEKTFAMKTKWSHFFDSDAVFAGYTTQCLDAEQLKYTLESNRVSIDNALSEIEIYMDEEDNVDLVKEIISDFYAILENQYITDDEDGNASMDGAMSLTTDSILMYGCSMADTAPVTDLLTKLQTWITESEPDLADKFTLKAPKVGNYKVSTFILPFDDIANLSDTVATVSLFEDRELAFVIGVKKGSMILLAGLDAEETLDKFNELAEEDVEEEEVSELRGYFSIPHCGEWLSLFVPEDAESDDFLPLISTAMEDATSDACLEVNVSYDEGVAFSNMTIKAACFTMIGDLIRTATVDSEDESDSDDSDDVDLFDDEESDSEDTVEAL